MKKRIVTGVITACLALCAAVWPQPDTREERPAPIPTHAAAAPKTDAVKDAVPKSGWYHNMIPTTFCRCGIEKRHPAHDERTHVRTCLRGDSVGICNRNRGNRQYRFSICSCLLHSISIYVTMLMLNCWTVLNFDRSYHESTNHIERQ